MKLSFLDAPTELPTELPTVVPTIHPTVEPSLKPTVAPTIEPSLKPTVAPSLPPTLNPTVEPSLKPTVAPTIEPSLKPTVAPSLPPTLNPTVEPSLKPTVAPSLPPTLHPTVEPSLKPTVHPTVEPSLKPTVAPSVHPTVHPTTAPSLKPSVHPSVEPSVKPSVHPTIIPTVMPSVHPTVHPTVEPSIPPTQPPSHHPTISGPGWLLESYYGYDDSTYTDPLVVFGTRTQTCLPISSFVQTILGQSGIEYYYKYSCGDGYVQFQMYSDADCLNAIHEDEVSFDFEEEYEGLGFNYHYGPDFYRAWYLEVGYSRFQCVDSADQYSFTEGQEYAVIEYFPSEEVEQCTTNTYTQFAAYQRDYCFGIYKIYETDDYDDEWSSYYQFTANDNTYISLTAYYEDDSCTSDSDYFVKNIFPIDSCEQNFYQSYSPDAKKKKMVEKRTHASNPFKFDSNTPTQMKHMMTKSFVKAQGKEFVPFHEKVNAMGKEWNKKRSAALKKMKQEHTKKTNEVFDDDRNDDDYRGSHLEYGNVYFTDDGSQDDYYSYSTIFDDEEYYNDFLPGFSAMPGLSEYYQWSNVPAVVNASSPSKWFTEVLSYDDVPALVSTRQTLTCMPFAKYGDVWFNYMVVCDEGYVHTMYFNSEDTSCEGDYRIQSKEYYVFYNDGDTGRRDYWDLSPSYDCSNVMFSEDFMYAINDDDKSYATEFFYSLSAESECTSSDESTTDVTMGVAILEDHCFTIGANSGEHWDDYPGWYYNDDGYVIYSAKYWVNEADNNQNIQFTVWEAAECNDKFVTETKEIEINMCYDYQPNTVYQTTYQPEIRRLGEAEKSEQQVKARNQKLASFEQHNAMDTPFNAVLAKKSPRGRALLKKHSATKETAEKDVEWMYNDYYHYNDEGETFFNNRMIDQKNQWFTIPTSPTIPPSEVPTVSPSQPPSRHPTVEPSVQPSRPPTVVPSISPTMAPNPPTLRPTPSQGMPTASPSHQMTYTFSVMQNLDGIDATTFNSDENNAIAFVNALTMAMPPLTSDNFAISDVSDAAGARRLRALTADAVDITYWVTYTVAETGYNDAQTAYSALITSLNTSVVGTDLFDGYLQVSATDKDAPDLLPTSSNSFTASPAAQIGTDDDSKPLTDNHHKVIVGVLVGLGGGLLLIAIIAWCIFGRGENNGPSQGYSNPQSVEMTGVDPTTNKSAI